VGDRRVLLFSVAASGVFAVVSLVWGLLAHSQMIVFDGLYSFVGVGLSLLATAALRAARSGADERWPWGREILEPLAITVKAVALAGLCLYAVVGGVGEILTGGRDIEAGWALAYAVVATVAGLAVASVLARMSRGRSDLVRAEAAEWRGDALLGLGTLAGFVLVVVLQASGHDGPARYVDPAMVVLTSLIYLRIPYRLVGEGLREVLTMAADPAVRERALAAVRTVDEAWGLEHGPLRLSKVGARLDVDVTFLVDAGSRARTVADFDAVRAALHDGLRRTGLEPSLSVGFTAERRWLT
jgi:cation diffusion facilitator family transporter